MSQSAMVPAEPIRRCLLEWIEKYPPEGTGEQRILPITEAGSLGMRIFGRQDNGFLRRLLNGERKEVSFDLADKILCRLNMVDRWRTDPELAEAYENVNLRALDVLNPTSPRIAEVTSRYVGMVRLAKGSIERAAKHIGVHDNTLSNYLKKRAA